MSPNGAGSRLVLFAILVQLEQAAHGNEYILSGARAKAEGTSSRTGGRIVQTQLMFHAIREGQGLSIVVLRAAGLLGVQAHNVVHIVQAHDGVAGHGQGIALGGQVNSVLLVEVHISAGNQAGELGRIGVAVAAHRDSAVLDAAAAVVVGQSVVIGVGLHSAGGRGSAGDRLHDIAVQDGVISVQGHGDGGALSVAAAVAVQDILAVVVVVIVGAVAQRVAVNVHQIQSHGSALVLLRGRQVVIHGVDHGVGVRTDDDVGDIAVIVLIDLQDVALAGQILGGGVVLIIGVALHVHAVKVDIGGVQDLVIIIVQIIAVGHQVGQALVGVGHDQGGVSVVGIGAHVVTVIDPGGRGTAEVIGVRIGDQLGEVLLTELHQLVLFDVAIRTGRGVGNLAAGRGVVDGHIAHNYSALLIILHHSGVDHVEGIQAGLLTGHGAAADEVVVAVIQADADGLLGDVDLPVGAGVVLDGAIIAQGAQQHLHKGVAGQGAGGTEGAVAIAGDDALLCAVGDVAREHVGGGHILEGCRRRAERAGGGGAEDQVADDLGSRAAGQGPVGTEGVIAVTVHDPQCGDHVDSFFVIDVAVIGEVHSARADSDQRHGHHQSEHQRKELLHVVCTSL